MDQKLEKKFFVSWILHLNLVAVNSHYYKDNTVISSDRVKNSPKILYITKRDIFQLCFPQSDGKT